MAPTIRHAFVSPKLDGPDPTIVRPTNWNADHVLTGSGWFVPSMIIDYVGHTVPTGFLEAYGQSVAAAAYPNLYSAMVKQATVTFTAGTPGVVNWTGHGLPVNSKVRFRNSGGALPVEITANVDYYIVVGGYTTDTFRISATVGGTEISFASGGTGTHTGINAQFGVATDLTTFTVPDLRGYVTAGLDIMGGSSANRLTGLSGGVNGDILGAVGGAQTHTLLTAELASHTHNNDPPNPTIDFSGLVVNAVSAGAHTHTVTGTVDSAGAHTHTVTGTVDAVGDHTHAGSGGTIGNAGAHTHTLVSGATDTEAAHSHTLNGSVSSGGAHSHTYSGAILHNTETGGANADRIRDFSGGDLGTTSSHAGHTHADTFSIASGGAHSHAISALTVSTQADHTHSITGLTIANAGGHSHTFSAGAAASAGAHTHTFSSGSAASAGAHTHTTTITGTITSAQADYATAAAGSGSAHNNVQPTIMVRKLIYVA